MRRQRWRAGLMGRRRQQQAAGAVIGGSNKHQGGSQASRTFTKALATSVTVPLSVSTETEIALIKPGSTWRGRGPCQRAPLALQYMT